MPNEQAIEWIVLITDGHGTIPSERALKREYNEEGITIQCAGVGDEWKENDLLEISQQTRGGVRHIKAGKQLQAFFSDQIRKTRDVVAVDTALEIDPSDHIAIEDVNYKTGGQHVIVDPEWRNGTCIVDLGDMTRGDPPRVKVAMEINPNEPGLSLRLLTATARTSHSGSASDDITVEAIKQRNLKTVSEETTVKPEPCIDPETAFTTIIKLGGQGKLDEAREKLKEHRDLLTDAGKYQDAKRRLEDFETSETGTSVRGLSTDID